MSMKILGIVRRAGDPTILLNAGTDEIDGEPVRILVDGLKTVFAPGDPVDRRPGEFGVVYVRGIPVKEVVGHSGDKF